MYKALAPVGRSGDGVVLRSSHLGNSQEGRAVGEGEEAELHGSRHRVASVHRHKAETLVAHNPTLPDEIHHGLPPQAGALHKELPDGLLNYAFSKHREQWAKICTKSGSAKGALDMVAA